MPSLFISSPFGYFSKTSILLATTAQTKELRYLSAEYELPVNEDGTIVQVKASYNKSYPGKPLGWGERSEPQQEPQQVGLWLPPLLLAQDQHGNYLEN